MIQRKQSIYLFIAAILTGILFTTQFIEFVKNDATYILNFKGIFAQSEQTHVNEVIFPAYPLLILIPLSTLISLVSIFLYKKRVPQIRLSGINIALQLGITASIFYLGYTGAKHLEAVASYNYVVVFPLIAVVLTILAIIAIGKDEALVRSLNRIR